MARENDLDPERYAAWAGFDGDWRDSWWHEDFLELMARRWDLARSRRALDVGCGVGHWGRRLLPWLAPGAHLVGVDREPHFVVEAKAEALKRGISAHAHYEVAHAERLPFPDGHFDLVTCQTVLLHVEDASTVLAEMWRVLAPGGLLALAEPDNLVSGLALRGRPGGGPETAHALLELALRSLEGKAALGHGRDDIGVDLPWLLAELGCVDVRCYANDKCATLVPPYESRDQQLELEQLLGVAAHDPDATSLGPRALIRERFLAGGGALADFDRLWSTARADLDALVAQVHQGRFHGARGFLLYLVSGRKPLEAA